MKEDQETIYAVSYARVSTDDKGQNPESQLFAIREWAAKKGNIKILKEFSDESSGTNDDRDGLDAIFGYKRRHPEVTRLIVLDADRLSRNMDDAPVIQRDLSRIGLRVVYVADENLDLTTKEGKLMNYMKAYADQSYVDELKIKIKAGMNRARAEGKQIGRPSKRGNDKIDIDLLFEFAKMGYSLRRLEKVFNVSRNTLVRKLQDVGRYEEFKQIQNEMKQSRNTKTQETNDY